MSEHVLTVVRQMEAEAAEFEDDPVLGVLLSGYARRLRAALAAGPPLSSCPTPTLAGVGQRDTFAPPVGPFDEDDTTAGCMVRVEDGPAAGEYRWFDRVPPAGARCMVGGEIYVTGAGGVLFHRPGGGL